MIDQGATPKHVVQQLERTGLLKQGAWSWFVCNGGFSKDNLAEARADRLAAKGTRDDRTPFASGTRTCVHFVGFRGDEYIRAIRVWGPPDFIHIGWDLRARREIAEGDTVVFARGDDQQAPSRHSYPDIVESAHEGEA